MGQRRRRVPIIIHFLPFGKTKGGLLVFGLSGMAGLILTRLNVVFNNHGIIWVAQIGSNLAGIPKYKEPKEA